MQPFAERSVFLALIEEQAIIPEEMLPAPSTTTESRKPLPRDVAALDELIDRLQDVEIYLAANEGEAEGALINQVLEFAKMLKGKIPMISTDDQFESSRVLRVALVKVPVEMLQRIRINPRTIVAISYFYATALAVAPLFPAMGAMVSRLARMANLMLTCTVLRTPCFSTNYWAWSIYGRSKEWSDSRKEIQLGRGSRIYGVCHGDREALSSEVGMVNSSITSFTYNLYTSVSFYNYALYESISKPKPTWMNCNKPIHTGLRLKLDKRGVEISSKLYSAQRETR
jgi:hypothetical protein